MAKASKAHIKRAKRRAPVTLLEKVPGNQPKSPIRYKANTKYKALHPRMAIRHMAESSGTKTNPNKVSEPKTKENGNKGSNKICKAFHNP